MRSTLFILSSIVLFALQTNAQIDRKIITDDELYNAMILDQSMECEWTADPASYYSDETFVQTSSLANYCGSDVQGYDTLCSGNVRCTLSPEFIRTNIDGSFTGNELPLYFTDVQCRGKRSGGGVACGDGGEIKTCLPLTTDGKNSVTFADTTNSSGSRYLEAIGGDNSKKQVVQ